MTERHWVGEIVALGAATGVHRVGRVAKIFNRHGGDAMTEAEWLASSDPAAMVNHLLRRNGTGTISSDKNLERNGITDRKLRLFACACCRLKGRKDAEVDQMELSGFPNMEEAEAPITDLEWATRWTHYSYGSGSPKQHNEQPRMEVRAALLRDIFGNPFRPVEWEWRDGLLKKPGENWFAIWLLPSVKRLAQAIHDERAFDRMPILADAMEEAWCQDEAILRHCRGEEPVKGWRPLRGPHVRGCHVLDLILGKE